MKIILNDRKELIVSDERGKKLKQSLVNGSDGFVEINDTLIKKSSIARIEPGGYTEADLPSRTDHKQLKADNRTEEEQYIAARGKAESVREILAKRGVKGFK